MKLVKSDAVMAYDTLPATKVINYYGGEGFLNVYTYAQAYFLKDALCLRLCVFEREPAADSGAAFAIGGADEKFLLLRMLPQKTELFLCSKTPPPNLWAKNPGQQQKTPQVAVVQDDDEQGWYWGVQTEIGSDILAQAGIKPDAKEMRVGVIKYSADGSGYGASFMPKDKENPLDFACFTEL